MYVGPGSGNKRDEKAAGKLQGQMEKESVRSGESMISRSTNGRFEGSTKFGEHWFVKHGMSKGGHQ